MSIQAKITFTPEQEQEQAQESLHQQKQEQAKPYHEPELSKASPNTQSRPSPNTPAERNLDRATEPATTLPSNVGRESEYTPRSPVVNALLQEEEGFASSSSNPDLNPVHATKHPRDDIAEAGRKLSKRPRPKLMSRHTVDPEIFPSSPAVTSPLFFSHTSRQRPVVTPAFPGSNFAIAMLNTARDETGGMTTLKLARGSIVSPARAASTPGMFGKDANSAHRSLDPEGGLSLFNSVGIVELLEQDDRPTFVIDTANLDNFIPGGPLHIVFANASLRAHYSILHMVTGHDLASTGREIIDDFPEFKSWALSFVKNHESLDISLPSFLFGGITWTCSTLRKRIRLISGSGAAAVAATSSNGVLSNSTILSEPTRGSPLPLASASLLESTEPSDYFGQQPLKTSASRQSFESGKGSPKQAMKASQSDVITSEMMRSRYPEGNSFDWTRLPLSAGQ